ncbi:MAG: hypothetical protein IPL65_01840 [Lewinellaceae bacterium]|nr:hypothetical protein [Lewinellaceae bacterium]
MQKHDNLLGVLQTIYRWRKAIRNVCILAVVGSIGFSLMLKNHYKATTVFYPASTQLANPELMFGTTGQVTDYFGSDRELDRLVEIANSGELINFMVWKFQLYQHYGYDSTSADGPFKVRAYLRSLYDAQKNKNDAIEVSVEDTDPLLAAEMANAARDKIDQIAQRLNKESQAKILTAFDDNIRRKRTELSALADTMLQMRTLYGIYAPESQGEFLADQVISAEAGVVKNRAKLEVLENNPAIPRDTIAYIKADLRAFERQRQMLISNNPKDGDLTVGRFNEGLPKVSILNDLHFQARKQLSYDLERYNQIKSAYNTDIPAVHIIETAAKPLIKSRPKRSIIVIATLVAAFLFSVLGALMADAYRDINWKAVTREEPAD